MTDLKKASENLNPIIPYAAAALVGIAIGLPWGLWFGQSALTAMVADRYWPKQGVAIYCPSYAGVSIADAIGLTFTLGKTSDNGSLSIDGLPEGKYSLTIDAPEQKPQQSVFDVSSDKPSAIGYLK